MLGQNANDASNTSNEVETQQNGEVLPGYSTIESFTKDGYKILMEAIKNSNCLPSGRDWNFYNTHEAFKDIMKSEGDSILKRINTILRSNDVKGNVFNRVVDEKLELIVEANDVILERVANNIDEMNGIRKIAAEPVVFQTVSAQIPINGSWNRISNTTFSVSSSITSETRTENSIRLLTAKNILRPQKFFKDKIVNSCKFPWEPRLKDKPNSLKPLAIFLEETENGVEYSHPYEFELEKFVPPSNQLKMINPVVPLKVEDTPLIEVNTPEQLDKLVEELRKCKEFAVDLEHHSYRSFMGITCLMQISTADKDYLIDTLALRDKLCLLNEVFTKPSIVKIFHGADMDVQWLQRDLSIYVVNMFDTHQAAKALGYSGLSLAYLMQRFCNFAPNKQFQLADWRIRPLPDELKAYAREDTHFLIYIHHMLKNELLHKANGQRNLLLSVINNSTNICKKRYFRPVLRDDSHLDFYRKCKRLFDNRQLYALKELYKWRDQISRDEDESTGYVLPNHMLLQISETLPREMQGILACCNPIPPLVRANLLEIHQIILRAKEQPLEKPIMKEDTRARGTTLRISKINVDSPLHCPHDLKSSEYRDDLPTLIGGGSGSLLALLDREITVEKVHSSFVFGAPEETDKGDSGAVNVLRKVGFLGPFERYKLIKPFVQAEEERIASENLDDTGSQGADKSSTDARTDEERIESIREHFLTLSRKTLPRPVQVQPDRSLVQMGGTKKRKREHSSERNTARTVNTDSNNEVVRAESNGTGKTKSTDSTSCNIAPKIQKRDDQNKAKRNRKRGKNKPKRNTEGDVVLDANEGSTATGNAHPQQRRDDDSKRYNNPQGSINGRSNKRRNNRRRDDRNSQSEEFAPYDYSSVDFRQFQGGGEALRKQRQFKSSFKNKGKRRKPNNGNKSATFGNARNQSRSQTLKF